MTFEVKFTTDLAARAQRASEQAAAAVFKELNGRFQDAIANKAWDWRRDTRRSNRQIIPSGLRNIVDTANLKDSNPGPTISGLRAQFRWMANHASFVHDGALIHPYGNKAATPVLLEDRPWTSAVLGTVKISGITPYPLRERFRDVWLQRFQQMR